MTKTLSRTDVVTTRLTADERNQLRKRVADAGTSPSKFVHRVLLHAMNEESEANIAKVTLAYLELLTEDLARLETVVTYIVANLRAGNNLTAEGLQQLTAAAARQKKGYAAARLKAARANALNGKNSHE